MLKKIPEIHVKCFKTVDARASGLHFTTPSYLSLKMALKVVSETTSNSSLSGLYVEQNTQNSYQKASKLWMPGPQDCILQHLF